MNHTIEMLLNTLKEQISSSTTDLNFILLHPSEGIFCCDDRVVEVILNGSLFSHSFYLFPRQKPLQIQPICGPYKYLLLTMALKHTIAQTVFTNSLLIYPNGEQQQIKEFYWRRKNSPFSMEYEQRIEQNPPELTYQCTIMDYKSTIELVTIVQFLLISLGSSPAEECFSLWSCQARGNSPGSFPSRHQAPHHPRPEHQEQTPRRVVGAELTHQPP